MSYGSNFYVSFAAADGFGAPVKLAVSATYTTTSSVVIGDRLQMTCNVTNTALKIREVKWFHIRERFGKERLTLTPQLIHRASNGDTTASLEFSVSRGMEGQYYCLVNSAFRSNTVKILVQSKYSLFLVLSLRRQTSECDRSTGLHETPG